MSKPLYPRVSYETNVLVSGNQAAAAVGAGMCDTALVRAAEDARPWEMLYAADARCSSIALVAWGLHSNQAYPRQVSVAGRRATIRLALFVRSFAKHSLAAIIPGQRKRATMRSVP